MKTKWLTYVKQLNLYQPGLAVFSEWLNDIADVQDEFLLSSNPIADRVKLSYKEKAKGSTFATSATNTENDNSKNQRECVLEDGKHPLWNCEKFKKMNVEERWQKAKELKLCFEGSSDAHQMRNCSGRLCDVSGCGKPHHRLLHRPYKNVEQKKNVENVDEVSNLSSMRSSGVLPVIPVTIGSGSKTLKTFALCDSGASLSFVDESLMRALNLTGQPVNLNVLGIHGTSDISSKGLRVKIRDQDGKVKEDIMAYSHPNVEAGNRTYNLKKLKETYPRLSVLKGLFALNCSVSGRFEANKKNSTDIFVVERNWQEVSTKTLLVEIKQVWQEETQLVAGDHIVQQEKNKEFSITEEKNEHERVAITSNFQT